MNASDHCTTFAARIHELERLVTATAQASHAKKLTAKNLRARHADVMHVVELLEGATQEAQVVASGFLHEAQVLEGCTT